MILSLLFAFPLLNVTFLEDNGFGDFGDLGKLLFGGVITAIVLAIGFTLIRIHLRDKKPRAPDFISINSSQEKDQPPDLSA